MQKTNRLLSLLIPPAVQKEIDILKARLNKNETPGAPFFPPVPTMSRRLQQVRKETGIPVHPHGLRHTCAVSMLRGGLDIYSVSRYLGHESVQTTERTYAKYVPERQKAALEVLERMFSDGKPQKEGFICPMIGEVCQYR